MKRIAIVVNQKRDIDFSVLSKVVEKLVQYKCEIFIDKELCFKTSEKSVVRLKKQELFSNIDAVISIGGDGTFLQIVDYLVKDNIPVIGVNTGHLGYITELEKNEIDKLEKLFTNEYTIEKRMLLKAKILNKNKVKHKYLLLNDAVVSRGQLSRIAEIQLTCNKKDITNYRADGLIISSPTGSTAYSLSAGGPIIEPQINSIMVTPICPHCITARPIIFSHNSQIELSIISDDSIYFTGDGYKNVELVDGDIVRITKASSYLSLIRVKDSNFYELLHKKFLNRGEFNC